MQKRSKNFKNKTRKQKTKVKSNDDYTAYLVVGGNIYELKKTRKNLKGGQILNLFHQPTMYEQAQGYATDVGNSVTDTAVVIGNNIKNVGTTFHNNVGVPITRFFKNKIAPSSVTDFR